MKIKKYEIANLKVSSARHERVYDKKAKDLPDLSMVTCLNNKGTESIQNAKRGGLNV